MFIQVPGFLCSFVNYIICGEQGTVLCSFKFLVSCAVLLTTLFGDLVLNPYFCSRQNYTYESSFNKQHSEKGKRHGHQPCDAMEGFINLDPSFADIKTAQAHPNVKFAVYNLYNYKIQYYNGKGIYKQESFK